MPLHAEAERMREADDPAFRLHPAFPPRARIADAPGEPILAPEGEEEGPPPQPALLRRLLRRPLFLALVLIPNLLSIVYFGLVASPVYTSTALLIVLNPKQNGPSLSSLLSGASGDSSEQGGYILKSYFKSWDAFRAVAGRQQLAAHFSKGDLVGRYGGLTSLFRTDDVALWRYFQRRLDITIDQKSGIVSLEVDAYDPAYAVTLARALLGDAVRHMDAMNDEQARDYIRSALARRTAAERALRDDLAALARYRSRTGTYDPKELYLSNLALMNSLAMKEAELKSQRDAIRGSTPGNPQAETLGTAMASVRGDIESTRRGFPTMARASSDYEKLLVSRDNDITLLAQANMALHEAQASAEKNRYYLNVISSPSEPGYPERPRRLLWIGGIFLLSLVLWGLLR